MTVPIQSQVYNPITGVFGNGFVQIFGPGQSGSWVVPPGVAKVRVRLWGAGGGSGSYGGAGGGFALKTIYDLTGVTSIPVVVGAPTSNSNGGTSSFGSYVSATGGGGSSGNTSGGTGVGGDINTKGGTVNGSNFGGGVGNLFGNGGSYNGATSSGCGSNAITNTTGGLLGGVGSTTSIASPTSGMNATFSLDLIGIGGAGYGLSGMNGGGGGGGGFGGFPGGGSSGAWGAYGLVIVEY